MRAFGTLAHTASYFDSGSPPQSIRFLHCRENVGVGKKQLRKSALKMFGIKK